MMNRTPAEAAALAASLRAMPWRDIVRTLKTCVIEHQPLEELPSVVRRWLEVDRNPSTPEALAASEREMQAIKTLVEISGSHPGQWMQARGEFTPVAGWVVALWHFLKDGKHWYLLSGRRHDESAPLVGPTVAAPATPGHLKALRKIVDYAGGNGKREVLRTGPLTQEERDALIAAGHADVAEYGEVFFWWKA